MVVHQLDETLELTLAGGRDAPARARAGLHGLNGSLAALRRPVSLLVSELVGNAVKHGDTGPESTVCVRLDSSPDRVHVEVLDEGPGFTPPAGPSRDPLREGFGLLLVDKLADRWGVEAAERTCVWFEIDR
jgi:anti-sigma regulatory factor (Ser/Thr protein kinase)